MKTKLKQFGWSALLGVLVLTPFIAIYSEIHRFEQIGHRAGYAEGYRNGFQQGAGAQRFVWDIHEAHADLTEQEIQDILGILKGRVGVFNTQFSWEKDGLHVSSAVIPKALGLKKMRGAKANE